MNNSTNVPDTAQKHFDNDAPARTYRPQLSFYHANGKGSGSAARFELLPAGAEREGTVYLTLAQQKSVASGSAEQGTRQHATFDWANRVTVKLNFGDLCQIIPVFQGAAAAIAEGKGLYHESRDTVTRINLARQGEPFPGWALEVSRKAKGESETPSRVRIVFNAAEAFGIGTVLQQVLGLIAFGVPAEPQSFVRAAPRAEPEPAVF